MTSSPAPSSTESAPAQPKPQLGNGTRLTATAWGFAYGSADAGQTWAHPFRASVGVRIIRLSKGIVEGIEPKIDGVPISGDPQKRKPQPALKLDPKLQNKNGESWVCIEVEPGFTDQPGPDGKPQLRATLDGKSRVEIVHTAEPVSHNPEIGRQPLAQLLWNGRNILRYLQIAHYNLRYLRIIPAPGGGAVYHLFF